MPRHHQPTPPHRSHPSEPRGGGGQRPHPRSHRRGRSILAQLMPPTGAFRGALASHSRVQPFLHPPSYPVPRPQVFARKSPWRLPSSALCSPAPQLRFAFARPGQLELGRRSRLSLLRYAATVSPPPVLCAAGAAPQDPPPDAAAPPRSPGTSRAIPADVEVSPKDPVSWPERRPRAERRLLSRHGCGRPRERRSPVGAQHHVAPVGFSQSALRASLDAAGERGYVGQTKLVYWDMGERLAAPPCFAAVPRPDAFRIL